jgi:hypothetical protein
LKSVNNPVFAAVRQHYNDEIETGCVGSNKLRILRDSVFERFETYSKACNADNLTPRKYKGKHVVFWELGKAFCRLASDTKPWRPSAVQVLLQANLS